MMTITWLDVILIAAASIGFVGLVICINVMVGDDPRGDQE